MRVKIKMELKITKETLDNFKPTSKMIYLCRDVFVNMANVKCIKPIVEEIQKKVLRENKFKNCHEKGEIIQEPKHSYLMSDSDFKIYHKQTRMEEDKVGLTVTNPEFCPLLVAEDDLRKAENNLIDVMGAFVGISREQLSRSLKGRREFIELNLRLLAGFI